MLGELLKYTLTAQKGTWEKCTFEMYFEKKNIQCTIILDFKRTIEAFA